MYVMFALNQNELLNPNAILSFNGLLSVDLFSCWERISDFSEMLSCLVFNMSVCDLTINGKNKINANSNVFMDGLDCLDLTLQEFFKRSLACIFRQAQEQPFSLLF